MGDPLKPPSWTEWIMELLNGQVDRLGRHVDAISLPPDAFKSLITIIIVAGPPLAGLFAIAHSAGL